MTWAEIVRIGYYPMTSRILHNAVTGQSISSGKLDNNVCDIPPDIVEQRTERHITLGVTNLGDRYLENMLSVHFHGVWRGESGNISWYCGDIMHCADSSGIVFPSKGFALIDCGAHHYQFPMLVDVVKSVENGKGIIRRTVPGLVWLQPMNECSGAGADLAESLYFSNVFSKFSWIVPRVIDVDGKFRGFTGNPIIGDVKDASEMIETRAQVVESLSSENAETRGDFPGAVIANGLFRELRVTIGDAQAVATFGEKNIHFPGEILDVLFGPF